MAGELYNSFPVDFSSIMEKLNEVDPLLYARTRNFANGAVTRLSPYISRGVISVKQVMTLVLQRYRNPFEIERFLQELAWREYFQRVWQAKGDFIRQDLRQEQPGVLHHRMISAVAEAKTGITAVDNAIQQLYHTGYMHNHLRMYTASITCNIGGAHWLVPSCWMYYHLLDGDIASNSCSWQWVAGAFAGKKYFCNQENINKYTNSNQTNTFLDTTYEALGGSSVPLTLKPVFNPELTSALPGTNFPVINTSKPTLIYNSYNLDPAWRGGEDVNRVLLLEPSHFDRYPVSSRVLDFIIGLSANIEGIQLYCGEVAAIANAYAGTADADKMIISKEHPAFTYYPGIKDNRDWMFPSVSGYHQSFFQYWSKCSKVLKQYKFTS